MALYSTLTKSQRISVLNVINAAYLGLFDSDPEWRNIIYEQRDLEDLGLAFIDVPMNFDTEMLTTTELKKLLQAFASFSAKRDDTLAKEDVNRKAEEENK